MEIFVIDGPPRVIRGLEMALKKKIKYMASGTYRVKSQNGNGWYLVVYRQEKWSCKCSDHKYRKVICKHIYAVLFSSIGNLPEKLGFTMMNIDYLPNGGGQNSP